MKLEPGMLIKTNYSGPYRVLDIQRGCTCPSYLDELDHGDEAPERVPHIHIKCTDPNDTRKRFYLNGWDEETLKSIEKTWCGQKKSLDYDTIMVLENDIPVQTSMFG